MARPDVEDIYPATPVQEGILFESLLRPESGAYWGQFAFSIRGELDTTRFRQVWSHVVARHAALRTQLIRDRRGRLLQVVRGTIELPWTEIDLRSSTPDERENCFQTYLRQDRATVARPQQDPLVRFALLRLADDQHRFVWSIHHAILDGWSLHLLLHEVAEGYHTLRTGGTLDQERCPQYRDYAVWMASQNWDEAEAYFRRHLKGLTGPTPLPLAIASDRATRPTDATYHEEELCFSAEETERLKSFARQQRVTLNALVQACWGVLLHRYNGEELITFGATMSGRSALVSGVESMIGLFINTLPMRLRVDPARPFIHWLQEVSRAQVELLHLQHVPLAKVKEWSEVAGDRTLFDCLLVYENYPIKEAPDPSWLKFEGLQSIERTNHPLTVFIGVRQYLRMLAVYEVDLFPRGAVQQLLRHLRCLLDAVIANPETAIGQLPLLSPVERTRALVEWNATAADHPRDRCVHELFEEQVVRTPEATAVVFGSTTLTFRQLNERANRLTHFLQARGIGGGDLVAVLGNRSAEMVSVLLGILKTGAAYLPLDPAHPVERAAFILADAGAKLVIRDHESPDALNSVNLPPTVSLDGDGSEISAAPAENPVNIAASDHLAYVIYTSGSTGKPKGVPIEHRSFVNLLCAMRRRPGFSAADSLLSVTTLSFDISGLEVFLPLVTGGKLIIAPRDATTDAAALLHLLTAHSPTVMQATPATWRLLVDAGWSGASQLKILCGGEVLAPDLARALLPRCASLWNLYGPTETTIWSTCCRVDDPEGITIGRPIDNTEAYILDAAFQPQPIGVAGELMLGGDGLARGYWNRPELTAEKFIPHPFRPGQRLYRTGDLASYLPDGNIKFLGRTDHQVKLRGFRIEQGEIETVLREHPGVRDAVVVVREDNPGDRRLVAYLVRTTNPAPTITELREHLGRLIPDYMVPAAFVWLEQMPLTPSGKTDRTALPAPGNVAIAADHEFVAPRTSVEKQVASIWQELLHVERVGRHDDFFALGGHSLLAMQILSRINRACGVALPLRVLFEATRLEELAHRVESALATVPSKIAGAGGLETVTEMI